MEFNKQLKIYQERFELILDKFLLNLRNKIEPKLFEALEYSIKNGGKRIRPILMFAISDMLSFNIEKIENYALAVEFIHTYSLIHDDLPSMDNDDFRRGKPSSHKKFGEAIAILTGDSLLNLAIETCLDKKKISSRDIKAIRLLFDYSGSQGMIKGQILDILSENSINTNLEKYIKIAENKTSKLIAINILIPAILKNTKYYKILNEFALKLGLLFQVTDDILDYTGTLEEIGKTPNKDVKSDKFSILKVLGLEKAKMLVNDLCNDSINILKPIKNSEFLIKLVKKISSRNK